MWKDGQTSETKNRKQQQQQKASREQGTLDKC